MNRVLVRALVVALVVALGVTDAPGLGARPAAASDMTISGVVTESVGGTVLPDVCVTLGPPIRCFTHTDANGFYLIDLGELQASPGSTWELFFVKQPTYKIVDSGKFVVNGNVQFNVVMFPVTSPVGADTCAPSAIQNATTTVYLPNITKMLGGANGWQTPFIVQNVGTANTDLEITYFRFLTGDCVVRRTISALKPGTSYAASPNFDNTLPVDSQFAVTVKSVGSPVVSVVNEHNAVGTDRTEAMSYDGFTTGAQSVYLPNITRRFFGYVTPFIIQNLGTDFTTATIKFVPFDGSGAPNVTSTRDIAPGRSKDVNPNTEPGLIDGRRYAVTVTSPVQPIGVVVNTHNDAPTVAAPVAYSANGITTGQDTVYGAYAVKGGADNRVSTIVVQNTGGTAITPSITFTPLGGGDPQTLTSLVTIPGGSAWDLDPRFDQGTGKPCTDRTATCLAPGEYSFVVKAGSGVVAAAVNVIGSTTAMGYTATPSASKQIFLPNVTRTLGGPTGWTTPILLQSVTATSATLKWYGFSDAQLKLTQTVTLPLGGGVRIDPKQLSLSDDKQYSVTIDGMGGTLNAIVTELASGPGDNAMIYEGFAPPIPAGTTGP